MPSKKQRRRRAKELRHEYEYVYVDEEGQEVAPEEIEDEAPAPRPAKKSPAKATASARPKSATQSSVRAVPPPSWQRVLKRGAIFAPFMFLGIMLLSGGKLSILGVFAQTLWLVALFIPFSYFIDRAMYRRYLRQSGDSPPARRQRRA
jgi:hypothetical protein